MMDVLLITHIPINKNPIINTIIIYLKIHYTKKT